jgi:aryl-alcohol dehydrogenase-like predicted oxidoreductase
MDNSGGRRCGTRPRAEARGKIARFGASVESVAEADECLEQPDCASLQIIFNIFRQTPETRGLLDRCRSAGVAVIVRLPLASGLLAGSTPEHHVRARRPPHRTTATARSSTSARRSPGSGFEGGWRWSRS